VFFARRRQKKFWIGLTPWWDVEGAWLAHFHHRSFAWLQWFSPTEKSEFKALLAAVHNVLASESLISEIVWYDESEINKRDPTGFPAPV
jgi:hypothetical protein